MKTVFRKVGQFFLDIVEVAVISMAIFVLIYLFLFQPHQVRGNSMYPNFQDKEYILTDKISYRFHDPTRGEVVVFKAPANEDYEYIKRIIATPGETIRISQGEIYINEELFDEGGYLSEEIYTRSGKALPENQTGIVADGYYVVMGDNRSHSSDSRDWGFVPRKNIVGKAWFRYWPPGEMGLVETPPNDL